MKIAKSLKDFNKNKELFFLALPSVFFILIFNYIPMYGLILPFKNFRIGQGFFKSEWVGLNNFKYLFTTDALSITKNTVMFNTIFIILGLVFAVGFALMLFELSAKFVKIYQTVLFFPYFISWVVASYVFLGLFDMDYGFLNRIITSSGGEAVLWYMEPKYWIFILPIANLWKGVGYGTIIYYTGLMGIDSELFEAANLDGASRLQQVRHISIPMLKPLIIMITLMSIGGIVKADFGLFFNLTRDSAALYPVTDVIDTYVYRALRKLGDVGMSSAAGFYQSVVGFLLILLSNYLVRKVDPENSLF
jgi:putative aldouronate transport system permease protein